MAASPRTSTTTKMVPRNPPCVITSEHLDGTNIWGTRAQDGDRAHFAAFDFDTEDPNLLAQFYQELLATYGPTSTGKYQQVECMCGSVGRAQYHLLQRKHS